MNHFSTPWHIFRTVIYIAAVLAFFLLAIDLLITSLGFLGEGMMDFGVGITDNAFVSLFIGLLATALIQSSSTTTSMIVAMVASGSIDMQQAIPMVMGANIGTTITSNIVSLSYITDKKVFPLALSAATIHDHFNILTVLVLFPLQLKYNFLEGFSTEIATFLAPDVEASEQVSFAMLPTANLIISEMIVRWIGSPVISLVISAILLFVSIKLFTRTIYKLFIGAAFADMEDWIFKNHLKSFGWGAVVTGALQSSSVTSSFIVPLVATGRVKLKDAYPFVIGANIGTTITALLAALFKTPEAVGIAVVHFMFNIIGGCLFFLVPMLNRLPLILSGFLGSLTLKHRIVSLIYIIITFFLLPFAFIYLTK